MATLLEQRQVAEDADLRIKMRQACAKAAQTIIDESAATPNHANRLTWAKAVLMSPDSFVERMLAYLIAKNSGLTVAQITGATDTDIQNAVNGAVDAFA